MDSYLQDAMTEILTAIDGMSVEELGWHPRGKWSSAQILEHLTMTFSGTAKGMQRVLAAGKNGNPRPTLKQRFFIFIVTGIGYFPSGRQAPEMVVPSQGDPATAVAT